MASLPDSGAISYNGFTFPTETETLGINAQYVYDSANRTVVQTNWTLSVRSIITGSPTDAAMLNIRRRLSHPGGALVVTGRGFGEFQINTSLTKLDVRFGPSPRELSFKPLGNGRACEIVWRVEVAVAECAGAKIAGIKSWNWSVTYEVDRSGYSTRTYNYSFEILNNRFPGTRGLFDNPENYLPQVIPALIPGFRRTFGPRTIDEAKARVTGTVIDTEMGRDIPPEYVTEWSADHNVVNAQPGNLVKWIGTISAEYELAKLAPDNWTPAKHFFGVLCRERRELLQRELANNPDTYPGSVQPGSSTGLVPLVFNFREPGIGTPSRKYQFSMSFSFVCDIRAILSASGLWRPVGGGDWKTWSASLTDSAFNPRGQAQLTFQVGDDRITDLCDTRVSRVSSGYVRDTELRNRPTTALQEFVDESLRTVTPPNSWLSYTNGLWITNDSGTVELRTLPTEELTPGDDGIGSPVAPAGTGATGAGRGIWDALANKLPGLKLQPTDDFYFPPPRPKKAANAGQPQRRVWPSFYVTMIGSATRASYPIPVPSLVKVGDVDPVPSFTKDVDGFWQVQAANAGAPIYQASWRLTYYVPPSTSGKDGVSLPPNPLLG